MSFKLSLTKLETLPIGVRNKGENSRLCHYCRCNSVKYYLESLGAKDEFIFTTEKMVHYYCKIFLIWLECLYLAGMFICEMRDNN